MKNINNFNTNNNTMNNTNNTVYTLYTTTVREAIDNYSIVIKTEGMKPLEVSAAIHDAARYSSSSLTPIGKPDGGNVYSLAEAIAIVGERVLHKKEKYPELKSSRVVSIPEDIVGDVFIEKNDECVILSLNTEFKMGDPKLLDKEYNLIKRLRLLFPEHLAYYKYRNRFILTPSDDGFTSEKYITDGCDIIKVTTTWNFKEVEI